MDQFSPPPAANGTSSLTGDQWFGSWAGGTFVTPYGYQHSLGISDTCGFFCVFFPPYLTLGDGVDTTKDTSRGIWKKLWVAIQNARRPADFWCD